MPLVRMFLFLLVPDSLGIPYATVYRDERENNVCSGDKSHEIQAAFNACSQSETRKVFETISEMKELEDIKTHFCSVLTKVMTNCGENLTTCFTIEDRNKMLTIELGQLRVFLARMTRGKLEQEDIDEESCSQAVTIQSYNARNIGNSDSEITDRKELISASYNFEDLEENARLLVTKSEELVKMTGTLVNRTLKMIDIGRKHLDDQQMEAYPLVISKIKQQQVSDSKNIRRQRHKKHKSEKPKEKELQHFLNDQAMCPKHKIESGKSNLEDCAMTEAKSLHSKLTTTLDDSRISSLLCKTMFKIKFECIEGLQPCLDMKEVQWFINTYIQEMEKYLLKMAWSDKERTHIKNCSEFTERRY